MTRSKARDSQHPVSPLSTGTIVVTAADRGGDRGPLIGASVSLYLDRRQQPTDTWHRDANEHVETRRTDDRGRLLFSELPPGRYVAVYEHVPHQEPQSVDVRAAGAESVKFEPLLEVVTEVEPVGPGERPVLKTHFRDDGRKLAQQVSVVPPAGASRLPGDGHRMTLGHMKPGPRWVTTTVRFSPLPDAAAPVTEAASYPSTVEVDAPPPVRTAVTGDINVSMSRTASEATADYALYRSILESSEGLSFARYSAYMNTLFFGAGVAGVPHAEAKALKPLVQRRFLPFTDTDSYRLMKVATEAFVMVNCGTILENGIGDSGTFDLYAERRGLPPSGNTRYLETVDGVEMLPYLAIIRGKFPEAEIGGEMSNQLDEFLRCNDMIRQKLSQPCLIELIWSYWFEESGAVQTLNAVTRRYQNVRGPLTPDPLANMEVNPLRPLSNLLWGYIQDEQHRLTIMRRNAEYDHHYGLRLEGRALQGYQPADSRSRFLEGFHHLLRLCTVFFKQDDDTTVKADAFGVLNALKEVHLSLSQGAHGQFGDLPATARIEMMMQQWLLARPEFREFLPSRAMVAYPEPWMDSVDAMKKLQGWTDTSVIHFHNLAVFGEQLLLAIRWGAWSTVFESTQAFNFARLFRPQIQGYIHAYRAATGVELGAETTDAGVDATVPAVLLQRRLAAQRRSA